MKRSPDHPNPLRGTPGYVTPLKGRKRPDMKHPPRPRKPLAERFWAKVNKEGPGGCWVWTATLDRGYGAIWVGSRPDLPSGVERPHRAVFWIMFGRRVPAEKFIDHLCRNRACVNPEHLRIVEPSVNSRENNLSPFVRNALKTHCKHGHEFTPENTAIKPGRPRHFNPKINKMRAAGKPTRICLTCYPHAWRWAVIERPTPPGAKKHRGGWRGPATEQSRKGKET